MKNNSPESFTLSILRIGPFHQDSDCANKLQKAILDHDEVIKRRNGPQQHQQNEDHQQQLPNLLKVSNKYFSANVLLQDFMSTESKGTEDGIILVFDEASSVLNTSSSSFDAVVSLFERYEPIQTPGEMLRLCVGIQSSDNSCANDNKERQAEYSRRVLWCLDHGFEYVSADLSPHAVTSGHDERDKEGFARVMEAIYGTMWSSSLLHNPTAIKNANLLAQKDLSHQDLPVENDPKATQLEKDESSSHTNHAIDETFDETIQEARRIRDRSMNDDLSDEQRRKRAEDAASLVLKMMNEIGIEDEEDDETN